MIVEVWVYHSACWVYVWEVYHHIFHTLLIPTLRVAVQIHQLCIVETQFHNRKRYVLLQFNRRFMICQGSLIC
jgi:hypothetical protein